MTTASTFRRETEREAYLHLHAHGWTAFREHYGPVASDMLDGWEDAGIARVVWQRETGDFRVRTFKKYAV